MIDTDQKQLGGERGLFGLQVTIHHHRKSKEEPGGKNPEAGTKGEPAEECHLPMYSS